jgi:hypothetical protein
VISKILDRAEEATSDFFNVGKGSGTPESTNFLASNQYFSSLLSFVGRSANAEKKARNDGSECAHCSPHSCERYPLVGGAKRLNVVSSMR